MRFAKTYDIKKMKLLNIIRTKFTWSSKSCSRVELHKYFFWYQFICFHVMSGYWGKRFYWKKCKVCSAKDVPKISENCIPKITYWNLEVCHFLSKSPFLVFSYYMMLFSYIYIKKYNLLGKIRVKIGQAEQKMEKHVRFSHILTIFDV